MELTHLVCASGLRGDGALCCGVALVGLRSSPAKSSG